MPQNTQTDGVIRNLEPEDHAEIAALAQRCFPVNQAGFAVPGEAGGKVITINDRVVAASLLRIIVLPSGRRIGFIAWLMTHPEYRGRRLASRLVAASTDHLQSMQCEAIVSDVEGYNTDSANVFRRAGYTRLSVKQTLFRWNPVDLIVLSIKSGLALDPGHFLWVAHATTPPHQAWKERSFAYPFNIVLALIAFALGGGLFLSGNPSLPSISAITAFCIGVGSLLAAREMGMRLVAWLHKQPLEFRAWIGGWGISLLIALGFGHTFPLPGNSYPRGDGWTTRHYQTMLGRGAIVSTLLVTCLIILGSLLKDTTSHEFLAYLGLALMLVGKPLIVFDTLVAIPPFEGFNGRHLRDYNRLIWLALSAIAIIIFIVV